MTCGMITPIHLRKRMNLGAHTQSRVTTTFLNSPKPNTTENQTKKRIVNEIPISIKSDVYIGERQS